MIHTRIELIEWLRASSRKDRVIHKAAHTGRIVNYGIFDPAPGSERRGWVLSLSTPRGHYFVAVTADQFGEDLRWHRIKPDMVDWFAWWGGGSSELTQGDCPERCKEARLSRSDPQGPDTGVPLQADGYPGNGDADQPVDQPGGDPDPEAAAT